MGILIFLKDPKDSSALFLLPFFILVGVLLALVERIGMNKTAWDSVIGHGIGGKDIPIMARLAKARNWSKR